MGKKTGFVILWLWHKKIHLWYAVIQIYEVIAWEKAERDSTSVPLFASDW